MGNSFFSPIGFADFRARARNATTEKNWGLYLGGGAASTIVAAFPDLSLVPLFSWLGFKQLVGFGRSDGTLAASLVSCPKGVFVVIDTHWVRYNCLTTHNFCVSAAAFYAGMAFLRSRSNCLRWRQVVSSCCLALLHMVLNVKHQMPANELFLCWSCFCPTFGWGCACLQRFWCKFLLCGAASLVT